MEVTRSWFDTWNRGDLDAFIDLYAADATVTPPAAWIEAGTLTGRPEIRRFFEGLKESWDGHDEAVLARAVPGGRHGGVPHGLAGARQGQRYRDAH